MKRKKAFTLVELSIVIVIIGLIIAGVTAGKVLVEQGKLRSFVTQAESYRMAYATFLTQYNAVPGDMVNAYSYWGSEIGCTNNNINSISTGCNGNGNNKIDFQGSAAAESFMIWKHLSAAKLIQPGFYNGQPGAASTAWVMGRDVPKGPLDNNSGFNALNPDVGPPTFFSTNFLRYGTTPPCGYTNGAVMTPKQVYAIDTKMDDGTASAKGQYRGANGCYSGGWYSTCNSGSGFNLTYNLAEANKVCTVEVRLVK